MGLTLYPSKFPPAEGKSGCLSCADPHQQDGMVGASPVLSKQSPPLQIPTSSSNGCLSSPSRSPPAEEKSGCLSLSQQIPLLEDPHQQQVVSASPLQSFADPAGCRSSPIGIQAKPPPVLGGGKLKTPSLQGIYSKFLAWLQHPFGCSQRLAGCDAPVPALTQMPFPRLLGNWRGWAGRWVGGWMLEIRFSSP